MPGNVTLGLFVCIVKLYDLKHPFELKDFSVLNNLCDNTQFIMGSSVVTEASSEPEVGKGKKKNIMQQLKEKSSPRQKCALALLV